jgi:hypothetical protein
MDVKIVLALKHTAYERRPTGFDLFCTTDRNCMIVFPLGDDYQHRIDKLTSAQYMERVRLFYSALTGVN